MEDIKKLTNKLLLEQISSLVISSNFKRDIEKNKKIMKQNWDRIREIVKKGIVEIDKDVWDLINNLLGESLRAYNSMQIDEKGNAYMRGYNSWAKGRATASDFHTFMSTIYDNVHWLFYGARMVVSQELPPQERANALKFVESYTKSLKKMYRDLKTHKLSI